MVKLIYGSDAQQCVVFKVIWIALIFYLQGHPKQASSQTILCIRYHLKLIWVEKIKSAKHTVLIENVEILSEKIMECQKHFRKIFIALYINNNLK